MAAPEVLIIETPGLGDRSYLVHDGEVAFAVDPQRDIDRVLDLAAEHEVRITHVFETHLHNDYVSGGLALARRTGAVVALAAADDVRFDHLGLCDGDTIEVGSMQIRARHTPGHTHTHLAYELRGADGRPHAAFTGGSMLYGTVGRTDLLGETETDELTRSQWRSVRALADVLPAEAAVYPTHGFGSFCSAQSAADRDHSTIGSEAADNLALTVDDVDRFVDELLSGLTEYPAYYAHMSLLNQSGVAEPDLSPPVPVDVDELGRRLDDGEWVLDLRHRRAFADRHLIGTANFALDGPFVTYVGWLIPWGSRLTVIAPSMDDVVAAQRELARIGIRRPSGAATGRIDDLAADRPVGAYPVADFAALAEARQAGRQLRVIDVRRRDEWESGHVTGALNLPIHELLDHLHHVPAGPLWVHCASGARAAIAASLLHRAGHDVVLVDDDIDAAPASLTRP